MSAIVPRIGDLVEVEWLDAFYDHDTSRTHDWLDECRTFTRGELVRNTEDICSIAGETFPATGEYRAVTHIPRPMVVRVVLLRRGRA